MSLFSIRGISVLTSIARSAMLGALLLLPLLAVGAEPNAPPTTLVVRSQGVSAYDRVAGELGAGIKQFYSEFRSITSDDLTGLGQQARQAVGVVVTVGYPALQDFLDSRIAERFPGTLIATFVTRDAYHYYLDRYPRLLQWERENRVRVLVLDQPLDRQARFISAVLPDVTNVLTLSGDQSSALVPPMRGALQALGMRLDTEPFAKGENIAGALDRLLYRRTGDSALLALPDQDVFARRNIKSIFYTTFRHRVPVISYAASHLQAGALGALYTTPEQIGKQSAELAIGALTGEPGTGLTVVSPRYFSVAINDHVAKLYGIPLADLEQVREQVLRGEQQSEN